MKQKALELLNSVHLRQTEPRAAILNAFFGYLLAATAHRPLAGRGVHAGTDRRANWCGGTEQDHNLPDADESGRKKPCAQGLSAGTDMAF